MFPLVSVSPGLVRVTALTSTRLQARTAPLMATVPGYRGTRHWRELARVKGGEKVYHCGGGIVYHRHDEKGLNWEPGGIRSGEGQGQGAGAQSILLPSTIDNRFNAKLRFRR